MKRVAASLAILVLVSWGPAKALANDCSANPSDCLVAESNLGFNFTPLLEAKADELGKDPVRIYEFVRNEIAFEHYFGLIKGPEGTLVSGRGNDYDQAALLVALLRIADVPARPVRGRIRLSADQAAAWTGTDRWEMEDWATEDSPAKVYLADGFPVAWDTDPLSRVRQNRITGEVALLHIWVEAYVPLANYRGRGATPSGPGQAWVPLDPSFVEHDWPSDPQVPFETEPALDFDFQDYYSEVRPRLPIEFYEDQVRRYLDDREAQDPTVQHTSVDQLLYVGRPVEERAGLLPTALPYAIEVVPPPIRHQLFASLHRDIWAPGWPTTAVFGPSALQAKYQPVEVVAVCQPNTTSCLNKSAADSDLLLIRSGYPIDWEGKRLVVQFRPDRPEDLKPEGYLSCTYTDDSPVMVMPVLFVDGVESAHSNPLLPRTVPLCTNGAPTPLEMHVAVRFPQNISQGAPVTSVHPIVAGGTYSPRPDRNNGSIVRIDEAVESLVAARAQYPVAFSDPDGQYFVDDNGNGSLDAGEDFLSHHFPAQEALVGGLLDLAGRWYWYHLRAGDRRALALYQQLQHVVPGAGLTSSGLEAEYIFDVPFGINPSNLLIDIKGAFFVPVEHETGARLGFGGSFELSGHQASALVEWTRFSGHLDREHTVLPRGGPPWVRSVGSTLESSSLML